MPRKKASRSVNEPKRPCSELVFGKDVGLCLIRSIVTGAWLPRVLIDNQDAGLELLKRGLCRVYEKYVTEAPAEMVEYGIRAICRRRAGDREHELDLDEAGGSQFCFMWGNCLGSVCKSSI